MKYAKNRDMPPPEKKKKQAQPQAQAQGQREQRVTTDKGNAVTGAKRGAEKSGLTAYEVISGRERKGWSKRKERRRIKAESTLPAGAVGMGDDGEYRAVVTLEDGLEWEEVKVELGPYKSREEAALAECIVELAAGAHRMLPSGTTPREAPAWAGSIGKRESRRLLESVAEELNRRGFTELVHSLNGVGKRLLKVGCNWGSSWDEPSAFASSCKPSEDLSRFIHGLTCLSPVEALQVEDVLLRGRFGLSTVAQLGRLIRPLPDEHQRKRVLTRLLGVHSARARNRLASAGRAMPVSTLAESPPAHRPPDSLVLSNFLHHRSGLEPAEAEEAHTLLVDRLNFSSVGNLRKSAVPTIGHTCEDAASFLEQCGLAGPTCALLTRELFEW